MKHFYFILVILISAINVVFAQVYEVGQSYFSPDEYIQYFHGNLPIILSAPHGGEKKPTAIPDRDCSNCVTINDAYTQELANEVAEAITDMTGCYPYVIINRLHRSKLDANRGIIEGADGNNDAEEAWKAYHDYIDYAHIDIDEIYSKGLFLDLHGHGHDIQRLELGYLLSKGNLSLEDAALNDQEFINKSSIKNLVEHNINQYNLPELIRGTYAFGSLLEEKNHACVPSNEDEYPLGPEPYFTGGYNTQEYGSRNGGTIDAIQIECNQDVRFIDSIRKQFAIDLAEAIIEFIEKHYFDNNLNEACLVNVDNLQTDFVTSLSPVPVRDILNFSNGEYIKRVSLVNQLGNQIESKLNLDQDPILNLSHLQAGIYFIVVNYENGIQASYPIVKI